VDISSLFGNHPARYGALLKLLNFRSVNKKKKSNFFNETLNSCRLKIDVFFFHSISLYFSVMYLLYIYIYFVTLMNKYLISSQ